MPELVTVKKRVRPRITPMFLLMAALIALITGALIGMDSVRNGSAGQAPPLYQVVDENAVTMAAYPFGPEAPSVETMSVVTRSKYSEKSQAAKTANEVRAVWISYLEMPRLLQGKTESQFRQNIGAAFDNVADFGLNTVIVQVRPFGDALYESDYFPWSYTITGTEGKNPGFDPLQVMIEEASKRALRIEAWLNPYRIRAAGNKNALSQNNIAATWKNEGNGAVISYNGALSYNPASEEARRLIVNGAVELAKHYNLDGIHIDDYFYPTTDAAYDKQYYAAYQKSGGTLSLDDWRRSNVETLIKSMYSAIKKANPKIVFGISPQSSVQNNYTQQYLDVKKIAGSTGYCDYICPQIYFGFQNQVQPYEKTLAQWSEMVKNSPVQLYVGLADYKVGVVDTWAGTGSNEWIDSEDLLKRMVVSARKANNYGGFALYRYDSVFRPDTAVSAQVKRENENLKSILK